MNARTPLRMFVISLILSPVWVSAQIYRFDPLPDLVPADIGVAGDCRLVVTLANNGPGIVPTAGYVGSATGVQMYMDGSPWGGIALGAMDPSHTSQPVGGTASYAWFPGLTLPVGTHNVMLQVDNNNSVAESNESNNVMSRTLTCQPPAPDLVPVSLTVNSQCQLVLTLRNLGTGPIPDVNFAQSGSSSAAIQMYNDGQPFGGISLGAMDMTRQVQAVGGTVTYTWFPGLTINGGPHTVTVVADNYNSIGELNEGNNALTQTLSCFRIIRFPIW
jgi:CARDB protein